MNGSSSCFFSATRRRWPPAIRRRNPENSVSPSCFASLGYTVAVETVGNGEDERLRTFFTMHATYDQLQSFEAADDIGYMFFLYDERVHPEEG